MQTTPARGVSYCFHECGVRFLPCVPKYSAVLAKPNRKMSKSFRMEDELQLSTCFNIDLSSLYSLLVSFYRTMPLVVVTAFDFSRQGFSV